MENNSKIYFMPGDIVTIRQEIPNKPKMVVVRKETTIFNSIHDGDQRESSLRGMKCRWFTGDGHMEEGIFNTKDLVKIEG